MKRTSEPPEQTELVMTATAAAEPYVQNGYMGLPPELVEHIFRHCNLATYVDIAWLMKLRLVCNKWTAILNERWVEQNMGSDLKAFNANTVETVFVNALKESSLDADATLFCIRRMIWLNSGRDKQLVGRVVDELFDEKKSLLDVQAICRIIKKGNLNINNDRFVIWSNGGHEKKSILDLCLTDRYEKEEDKYAVFDLLVAGGLDISKDEALVCIVHDHLARQWSILTRLLEMPHKYHIDYKALFSVLCRASRDSTLIENNGMAAACVGHASGYAISQLIHVCQEIMSDKELLSIAAYHCNAPLLSKLLDNSNLTQFDCTSIIQQLHKGYRAINANQIKIVMAITQPSQQYKGGLICVDLVPIQSHLVACVTVLKNSKKCIFPQSTNNDPELTEFFNDVALARASCTTMSGRKFQIKIVKQ